MNKYILVILATLIFAIATSNSNDKKEILTYEELENSKLYFSIEEAIENKAEAYRLCQGGRSMEFIPEYIDELVNLQYLNAAQNRITRLPDAFCKLNLLQEINFAGNDIEIFPECLANMKYLKRIDFSSNPKIDWLQAMIILDKCNEITDMDLSYNEITKFPENFDFPKLKLLVLSGNTISETEQERIKNKLPNTKIIF